MSSSVYGLIELVDGWIYGWMDKFMNGWMDGRMEEWMKELS